MKRDLENLNLRDAFGPMPEETYDALMKAACSVKEEEPVVKKISASMILVAAILAVTAVALAAGGYFGWFDFYSSNYGIQLSDTAQRVMKDSQKAEYTVENVTFSVSETYCDGYTALVTTQVSLNDGTSALITGGDAYDYIGINSESGDEYAKKLGVAPDTTWADAAKQLNLPLYLVRVSLTMPEELVASEFMEDAMTGSNGEATCFCMASLNGKAYGETVNGQIEFGVRLFNMEDPEASPIQREAHDISFMLEAPIDTKEYIVPENALIGGKFSMDSVSAVWMGGGLYIVPTFTALDSATKDQAYELLQEIMPVDENDEEYELGLNLSGNILNLDNWPTIEMVRMTTLNEIPETLRLAFPDTNGNETMLVLQLKK